MIQRTQSLYLAAVLIFLTIVTLGAPLFNFYVNDQESHYILTSFGVKQVELEGLTASFHAIPFYFAGIILITLSLFTLVMFKNLKRQLALARFTAFLYFIVLVFAGFARFLGTYFTETKDADVNVSISYGFYLLLIGFPLFLLAVRGINKDKKLIDSVNRLR